MSGAFNRGVLNLQNGTFDFLTDTFKVMLVTSSYTFDPDDDFVDEVSAAELTGTGYTGGFNGSGRKTLTGKTVTLDDANNRVLLDADNLTWSGINAGTIAGAIIIKEISNDASSILVGYLTVSPAIATNGGDIILAFATAGIFAYNT